ncbi:MAG: hypothetical protein C4293_03390 [Nitrospiraceae bacterium]
MPRQLQAAAISFGLIDIPVRLYTAVRSKSVSFHLLHQSDSSRIRLQLLCAAEQRVVSREEITKGLEISRGRHVGMADEELETLEAHANQRVGILEYVPLQNVDPVYFEKTYYLGPERGGEKPYQLLARAMQIDTAGR